jgi:M6 family metalloprotease-like protein
MELMGRSNSSYLRLAATMTLAVFSQVLQASPSAMPEPALVIQPDGAYVEIVLQGDAGFHWYQTPDGYLITKNESGQWVYAIALEDRRLIQPTTAIVGDDDPAELSLLPFEGFGKHDHGQQSMHKAVSGGNPISSKLGNVPMLVIMGYYDDALNSADCTTCATTHPDYVQQLFFASQQNSVANFFETASKGAFTLSQAQETHGTVNDGLVGWLRLGAQTPEASSMSTSSYKSNRVASDAFHAAMDYVDFTQYDADGNGLVTTNELGITVILGGYEASFGRGENGQSLANDAVSPRVWGQSRTFVSSYSGVAIPSQTKNGRTVRVNTQSDGMTYTIVGELHGSHPLTMGIVTHELGHTLLDLPDLYDTDGSGNGIGAWSLMGYGSWGKSRNDSHPGATPVMLDAWSRMALAWSTPLLPDSGELANLSAENLDVAIIPTANSYEYFLVENRQNQGYDQGLYYFLDTSNFGGLAIWHIDDAVGSQNLNNDNANASRKRVDLVAAQFDEGIDDGSSYGHANNLFEADAVNYISYETHGDMTLYSGESSGVAISNISYADVSMSFTVYYDGENVSQLNTIGNGLTANLDPEANAASSGGGGGGAVNMWVLLVACILKLGVVAGCKGFARFREERIL